MRPPMEIVLMLNGTVCAPPTWWGNVVPAAAVTRSDTLLLAVVSIAVPQMIGC